MTAAIPDALVQAVRSLPSTITPGQGGELVDTAVAYRTLKALTDIVNVIASGGTGGGGGTLPDQVFAARLAAVKTAPVNVIYAGSSSVEGQKATTEAARFVNIVHGGIQLALPSGRPSSSAQSRETAVQVSLGGVSFTPQTVPGVHGYNAGKGGTISSNFLLNADISTLATTLLPAAWIIQVGSNDAAEAVTPAAYKQNLQSKITAIKAATPAGSPYAIFLIHQYLRPGLRNPTYGWDQYWAALKAIADEDPATVRAIDMSTLLPGVPGPDNSSALATGYIDADLIHMTNAGHRVWAAALYPLLFGGSALPAGTPNFSPPAAASGSDTFSGGASATSVPGWTSNNGTWQVTSGGVASLASGSNGVLSRDIGQNNGQVTADVIYPNSGFLGVRGRVVGSNEGISFYIDKTAATYNLSMIVNGTNTTLVTGVAIPAGVAVVGQALTLGFTFVDDALAGFVNGTQVIAATLTPQQMSMFSGTSIALRQTVAGVANGTFDNVAWSNTVTLGSGTGGGAGGGGTGDTVVATEAFTGAAGAAWPAQWISNYGTGPAAVQNGSAGGTFVTPTTAYGLARTQYLTGVTAAADMEIRFDWQPDNTLAEQYFRAALRSPGTIDTGTGNTLSAYEVSVNNSATAIVLNKRAAGGGATSLGSVPWTFVAGQKLAFRFQTVGADIRFRVWVAGTTEPTTWSVAARDFDFAGAGKPFFKYSNGAAASSRTGTLSNVTVTLPGTGGSTGTDVPFVATANTPMPVGNLPGWDQVVANDFNTDVAAGSSGFRAAYPTMTTYDNFGDTAWNAIVRRDRDAGGPGTPDPSRSAWYSDKTLSVANSQLICRVGWDAALQKNLVSFILPRRYTGHIMGRVDFLLRTDVIQNYKIVPLWWSVADVWADGEIDYPESNDLGTTFKAYIHNTLGSPSSNVLAREPVLIPGNATPPRLDSWHVFSQRWTETEISFWLDGVKVVTYAKPGNGNGFPTNPMRFGLQIEAKDLDGRTLISQSALGNVQVGWVTQYTRNAATA